MRRIKREGQKGAMGVGALIVFIAMVLVAAVAANVLINTSNQLQQQTERTGDEAIQGVSNSFKVFDVYGVDGDGETGGSGDNGEIDALYLKIGLVGGASAQDMENTIIQISNDTFEQNLQNGSLDGSHYNVSEHILEQEGDDDYYLEPGDMLLIQIDITEIGGEIGTQEDISINLIPKHGTPTYEEVTTPPTITSRIVDLT